MKKLLVIFLLVVTVLPSFAQTAAAIASEAGDIRKNPFFIKSEEYRNLAKSALEAGDYKKALEYSNLGIAELDKFRGNNGILLAEQRLREARQRGFDTKYPELYTQAVQFVEQAKKKLVEGDFTGSVADSDQALALIKQMFDASGTNLVSEYKVITGDSLWRIANKPQVYNDKFAWPKIYMANKDRMRYPDNPNLIYPDQIFRIPR